MLKYFEISEFECKCGCGESKMDIDFLLKLDKARMIADTPFKINSGYRCRKHNLEVGSTSENHTSGHGSDIDAQSGPKRGKILKGLYRAGFTRIGIHPEKKFIHVDDMNKTESCWIYD